MRTVVAASLLAAIAGLIAFPVSPRNESAASATESPSIREFHAYHEHVIGTSLELYLVARSEQAAGAAEDAALAEIERLRQIFSLYDASSELSQLNRTREAMTVSPEMIEVLRLYAEWHERTGGVLHSQVGGLVDLWKQAERNQREPAPAHLAEVAEQLRKPGWKIEGNQVMRLNDQPLNLNAIAKGYIVQKAALAAQRTPGVEGVLLNLGGDIAALGVDSANQPWAVGVQNPLEPFDNARPIASLLLKDQAIASSGGYERFYEIQGKKLSHLFDPRTGRSAVGSAGATVVAKDNTTANALATTLCILSPEEGLKLVSQLKGVECLIVARDGTQHRSPQFASLERRIDPPEFTVAQDKKAEKWPEGYRVELTVTLPESTAGKRYRRPYVAVWAENADGKAVRTITEWGNNPRWISTLPQWWKLAKNDPALVKAVSRATRSPGKHSVVWDGKDDKGNPLPQGTYTIHVEVHREHGKLVQQTGKIACAAESAKIVLEKNAETGDTVVEYAKKKTP
jgi:thiamine biosynthesis lipoprotein